MVWFSRAGAPVPSTTRTNLATSAGMAGPWPQAGSAASSRSMNKGRFVLHLRAQ